MLASKDALARARSSLFVEEQHLRWGLRWGWHVAEASPAVAGEMPPSRGRYYSVSWYFCFAFLLALEPRVTFSFVLDSSIGSERHLFVVRRQNSVVTPPGAGGVYPSPRPCSLKGA